MHGSLRAEYCGGGGGGEALPRPPASSAAADESDRGGRTTPAAAPTCAGCERRISDQYLLRVAPDLEWHAACLKCADCGQPLDETCTCFVHGGKTYCRRDYVRFDRTVLIIIIIIILFNFIHQAVDKYN